MKDLTAPIVPGESAAGLVIGHTFDERAFGTQIKPFESLSECRRYFFKEVSVWVSKNVWEDKGVITQIGLHNGYLGKIGRVVGIGSTLEEVFNCLGVVEEDEWDNLIVAGIEGLCFESEEWDDHDSAARNKTKKITEIFVFRQSRV